MKNMYPSYLIDKQVKHFLYNKFSQNCNAVKEIETILCYKLHCMGSFSNSTQKKVNIFLYAIYMNYK